MKNNQPFDLVLEASSTSVLPQMQVTPKAMEKTVQQSSLVQIGAEKGEPGASKKLLPNSDPSKLASTLVNFKIIEQPTDICFPPGSRNE
ncbi:hypothetical protein L2E82_08557 [Cichorium intybus]|uniref:Uncharacterized protein n=1 Tax=Cichorium intybus TaxID=13427 RepID=A0ACB9G7N6_CICIN|nr:hypothetical protein L2E82_08557 [Cichorium intybus]